jgi:hypothetical protein
MQKLIILLPLLVFLLSCSDGAGEISSNPDSTCASLSLPDSQPASVQVPAGDAAASMPEKDLDAILGRDPFLQRKKKMGCHIDCSRYDLGSDSLWVVTVMDTGYFMDAEVFVRAYQKRGGFHPVLKQSYSNKFISDTVFDANFDGNPDLVIEEYHHNGCCPRDGNIIFLNRHGTIDSNRVFWVINAFYDAPRQAIYEMGYGHSPYCDLTKSVWKGDSLILQERISRRMNPVTGEPEDLYPPFVRVYTTSGEEEFLTRVPDEYTRLREFDWF